MKHQLVMFCLVAIVAVCMSHHGGCVCDGESHTLLDESPFDDEPCICMGEEHVTCADQGNDAPTGCAPDLVLVDDHDHYECFSQCEPEPAPENSAL